MSDQPHVLLVDDEPMTGDLITRALDQYKVSVALDAEKARAVLKNDPPDVVLLDIMLPGIDGLTFLPEVQKNYPTIPVVIITAYTSSERAIKALRNGAYDFLEKPTAIQHIRASVNRALERRQQIEQETQRLSQLEQGMSQLITAHKTLSARQNIELVRQIAQGLSHEINNPLCAIRLGAELIKRTDDLNENSRDKLEIINNATRRLEETMNALRMLSFVAEDVEQVSLERLLGDAVSRVKESDDLGSCRVELKVPEGIPPLKTRPNQVGQAVENILHNAIDAVKNAEVEEGRITITVERYKDLVNIAIHNNGASISKADMPNIFEPSYTTKHESGRVRGLGLGLYVARSVTEANQGRLAVRSEEGKGVTVDITLPLSPEE
jgi:two-component system sensor histidine kinase/response regulator